MRVGAALDARGARGGSTSKRTRSLRVDAADMSRIGCIDSSHPMTTTVSLERTCRLFKVRMHFSRVDVSYR